jgi:hypothetical protein
MLGDNTINDERTALVAWAQRLADAIEAEADYAAMRTWAASRPECATLHQARKRLRACDELWPDNKSAWCEQCRGAQKNEVESGPQAQ